MTARTRTASGWRGLAAAALSSAALFASLAAAGSLGACTGGEQPVEPEADSDDPEIPGTVGAVTDPSGLVARMRPAGGSGEVPSGFYIHLDRGHFASEQVGQAAPEGTELSFEPEVKGRLVVSARNTLLFQPAEGFLPDTAYTATLEALGLPEETRPRPEGATWTVSFETPPFGLVRMALASRDLSEGRAEVSLVFSAPVEASEVAERVSFRLGRGALVPLDVLQGDEPNEVRVRFRDSRLQQEGTLSLTLARGLPLASDAAITAEAGASMLELRGGQPMEILAVMVKEGVSGHYLDVVCKDESVEDERYWWDPDTYDGWWISNRCSISADEAARVIHLDPPVETTVATGPAGFRLFGDFAQGRYELTIDAGTETVDGGVLREAWEGRVTVPARSPRLGFASKGRYLPRSAWDELTLTHLNVDEARLQVRHVRPENLVFWMTGQERADERTSDLLLDTTLALGGEEDVEARSVVDVGRLLPEAKRGVYELTVEQGSARDATRLLLTDMHLVVKRGERDPASPYAEATWVWALDVHDNALLSGVEVDLLAPSGRVMASCETGSGGGCVLKPALEVVDEAAPVAVIATKGKDLTYLRFADLELQTEEDISGLPYRAEAAVRAAVYADRGVYRPGDTAHVAALVRDAAFVAPEAGLPVVLKLYDPRDKELRKVVLETDGAGFLTHDLAFADFATTGSYRVVLEVAEREVGQLSFAVEEFVPERMKVTAEADVDGVLPEEPVGVDIEARWLFGGSAEGSRVELACELLSVPFKPESNRNFHYGLARMDESTPRPVSLGTERGRLGEGGEGTMVCPAATAGGGFLGSGQLRALVSVFEGESGRSTKATARAPVHPERFYLGTKADADVAERGRQVGLQGVVVDWGGERVLDDAPETVDLEVFRLDEEVGWIWDDLDQTSRYRRILRRVSTGSETLVVSEGRFSHRFTVPGDAAGWLFVVTSGDARTEHYVEGSGRRYWWNPGEDMVDQTPRPQKPTSLAVKVPAETRVGETVGVETKAPWAGRLLWTVETDGVVDHAWQTVSAGPVRWTFEVEDFAPNVYVSALLIKDPHLESQQAFLPDRAHGVASVRVVPEQHVMAVKLQAPEEVQPYGPLAVKLDLGPGEAGRVATVAVVDEGILQLTSFESPDPLETIFARRALGVDSFETVGWTLLSEPGGAGRTTGGDADGSAGGRVQMVKPLALWSGRLEVPESGKLTVPFELPGYRGQVRVMAVVASKDRLGSADTEVLVRDPLVLQSTLPRFLVGGDEADIPVFVNNMSGADREVTVKLEVEEFGPRARAPGASGSSADDAVRITSPATATLSLADGASDSVVFQVQVGRVPSAARFRVTAAADGLLSKEELEVPLLPSEPEVRSLERVALTSKSTDLSSVISGWLPGSDHSTVWVSTNPYSQSLGHLGYLVRYPYGCIEQTTSSTRPLLYVRTLMDEVDPGLAGDGGGDVDEMVASGIERVLSMQTAAGGFGYWPGASYPDFWGTAYGTHLLLDAREAGHDVPEAALSDAVDWLEREVERRGHHDSQRSVAYAHYVIALAGKGQPELAADALAKLPEEPVSEHRTWRRFDTYEARYLLMAAMYQGGDRRHEAELRSPSSGPFELKRTNDWSYYSELRARGLVLTVYQDLFGADRGGQELADRVAKATADRPSRWYTTQELAWAITGLGKRVAGKQARKPAAELKVGGRELSEATSGSWQAAGLSGREGVRLELEEAPGDGVYAMVSTRGVRAKRELPAGGEGLALSRRYLLGGTSALPSTSHDLGDTVLVEVKITNTAGTRVQNIALVDRIPAGWEIENPRLGQSMLPDSVDADLLWEADHMNVRDDRVEVFGHLEAGESRTVVYQVRAVTAGSFTIPEVSAEAMYDPGVWARQYGKTITIEGPWGGSVL